ncbi:peptidase S8/S53 domain-containing protein [Syncephalis fuscata]|nr:peptidase S8/S53 domain-containing protein [Syncephalis fuscata]
MVMQTHQFITFVLLLLCSTQHFIIGSTKIYDDNFYAIANSRHPVISSKITGKPIYVTPYYVPTGIQALHTVGFKGKGVKLGIIDSGINLRATAFEGNYEYNHKFIAAKYGQFKDRSKCNKRGIGLAGIAVAKTNYFTGVAPEATLGTYCVFGCEGPTSSSIVLQALTTAVYKDQMKIIVLPEIAIADESSTQLRLTIEDAAKHGVIMIVAATVNNFIDQQHFSYKNLPVLGVGGAKQKYRLSHWFEEKTTGRRIEFTSRCSDMSYSFGEVDIFPNDPIGAPDGQFNGLHQGGIALIWYRKTEINAILKLAKTIGMTALIIVNDSYKLKQQCDTPLFSISEEDALFIKKGYKNKPRYKYIFAEKYGYTKYGSVAVDTAGPQDQPFIPPFYPDILAPSYDVYTTTVYEKRGEPHFSDISAAVAYVAGATALIVELNRNRLIGIGYIKAVLQNSAVPVKDRGVNYYAPALYQGAGMINLNKLIDARSIRAEPSSVNMGYTYAKVANVPIKISSLSATSLSYSFLHIPTAAVPRLPHTIDMSLRSSVIAEVFFQNLLSYSHIR